MSTESFGTQSGWPAGTAGVEIPPALRPVDLIFPLSFPFGARYSPETMARTKIAHPDHRGADFKTPVGTPARFCYEGEVSVTGDTGDGWGNHVTVESRIHPGVLIRTTHAHMSRVDVKKGAMVKRGAFAGLTGESGAAAGHPHLHLEVRLWTSSGWVPVAVDFLHEPWPAELTV